MKVKKMKNSYVWKAVTILQLKILAWIAIVIFFPVWMLLALFALLSDKIKWNNGICGKCKSSKFTTHSNGSLCTKYICRKCNHTVKIFGNVKELETIEYISMIRDNRLGNLLRHP